MNGRKREKNLWRNRRNSGKNWKKEKKQYYIIKGMMMGKENIKQKMEKCVERELGVEVKIKSVYAIENAGFCCNRAQKVVGKTKDNAK